MFSAINSAVFEECFVEWVSSISDLSKGQLIAIDGKTLCGANEITAILELLDILDIEQTTITIDAMGTQKEIAEKIVDKRADYILAVKENQAQLLQDKKDEFRFSKQITSHTNQNLDHGRIESRICSVK